jgi:menaquinone-dependent protoporphyrinogen oxidase
MRVLVVTASRHGATEEIGEAIARRLAVHGLDARTREASEADGLERYDAVVLGSAVYMGRWLAPAREFAESHESDLRERLVWVFSSGPIDGKPDGAPQDETEIARKIEARGHRVFEGRLDKGRLHLGERAVAGLVRSPDGDFRDWDAVDSWADEIAAELAAV